jgi:hypothetical protein
MCASCIVSFSAQAVVMLLLMACCEAFILHLPCEPCACTIHTAQPCVFRHSTVHVCVQASIMILLLLLYTCTYQCLAKRMDCACSVVSATGSPALTMLHNCAAWQDALMTMNQMCLFWLGTDAGPHGLAGEPCCCCLGECCEQLV